MNCYKMELANLVVKVRVRIGVRVSDKLTQKIGDAAERKITGLIGAWCLHVTQVETYLIMRLQGDMHPTLKGACSNVGFGEVEIPQRRPPEGGHRGAPRR